MFRRNPDVPSYLAPSSGPSARTAPPPQPRTRLFTLAAQLRDGRFAGRFHAGAAIYQFTYAPASAALARGRLELTGTLEITGPGGAIRTAPAVRARLLASQGSVADAPPRPRGVPSRDGARAESGRRGLPAGAGSVLPVTESTGGAGSAGALYFEIQPLDGPALGVPLDLGRVQLNARLAPDGNRDREIFWIWADLVATLAGRGPGRAGRPLRRLNSALRG